MNPLLEYLNYQSVHDLKDDPKDMDSVKEALKKNMEALKADLSKSQVAINQLNADKSLLEASLQASEKSSNEWEAKASQWQQLVITLLGIYSDVEKKQGS